MQTTLILALCAGLAACAVTPTQQSFCSASRPIVLDKKDKLTPATLEQVKANNETGRKFCGWFGSAKPSVEERQKHSFCTSTKPIIIDKKDVLAKATLRTIVGINETGLRLCGWKRP